MVPVPSAEQGNVSVVVRVRPQASWEQESNRPSVVHVVNDCLLVFDPEEPSPPGILAGLQGYDSAPRRKGKDLKFVFDRVFGESATQAEVFENTTKEVLDGVLNGYNCSAFLKSVRVLPQTAEQLLDMLARGNQNRTQHPTDINATSSRSHAIFQIYVKQRGSAVGVTRDLRVAKMSLIDLAGSERASVANTKGERLREGANINRSLLALINVINALADAKSKKPHIPYRDSKLTRLLKDSIGGNCRTIMIAAVSPSVLSYEDTYNTLRYANRAKEIKLLVADLQGRLRAYEEKGSPRNPPGLAPPGPEQAELLRVKEAGLAPEGDQQAEAESERLKLGCGTSCLGERSPKQ
ncbi:PREDICTED: kinesin-like protein KIF18B, partial [Gekko japonicus]|uniref:Kinesin-like protein n=1 Tax=Gekko japonicus TaxID=146911 RepID=A0ABM1JUU6_GEKJA